MYKFIVGKKQSHEKDDRIEVYFIQDYPLTVCVIRQAKDLGVLATGVSFCNPKDTWDEKGGRHKAFKNALYILKTLEWMPIKMFDYKCNEKPVDEEGIQTINFTGILISCKSLPSRREFECAYWEFFKEMEK